MRKVSLAENEYYHIFNRSIAGFKIYNNDIDYQRFIELVKYYRHTYPTTNYAELNRLSTETRKSVIEAMESNGLLVDLICYCIMPTHFHLLLKQNEENGISKFLGLVENSYSRYFNITHKRKGPLWESRFKSVHIDTNEQLLHLTRYIHLNPSSAGLVRKPQDWEYSSYKEYFGNSKSIDICSFKHIINISSKEYKKFVNDRKGYQRQLSMIKSQLIDNYTG